MRKILVWLAIAVVGQGWEITFSPHPDNKAVQLITECKDTEGKLTFYAVNAREVSPDADRVWFPTPRGTRKCHHEIQLVRFGDDPTQSYVAERFTIP